MASPKRREAAAVDELDFPAAMREVIGGQRVTRVGWSNPEVCVYQAGGWLMIQLANHAQHTLTVSEADMLATDWVVARQN